VHLATLVSVHCARPATGAAGARRDKDIPTGQTLPNPDDARPIVRHPTDTRSLPAATEPGLEPRVSGDTASAVMLL
jgi:hypothetical protein